MVWGSPILRNTYSAYIWWSCKFLILGAMILDQHTCFYIMLGIMCTFCHLCTWMIMNVWVYARYYNTYMIHACAREGCGGVSACQHWVSGFGRVPLEGGAQARHWELHQDAWQSCAGPCSWKDSGSGRDLFVTQEATFNSTDSKTEERNSNINSFRRFRFQAK